MATELKVKVGDSERVEEVELADGQWIICKDNGEMYFDHQGEKENPTRYPIGGKSIKDIEKVEEQKYELIDGTFINSGVHALIMNDTEEITYAINQVLPEDHYKVFLHNGEYRLETSNIIPGTFKLYKDYTNLIQIAEQGEHVLDENDNVVNENIYYLISTQSTDSITFDSHQLDSAASSYIDGAFKIVKVTQNPRHDDMALDIELENCDADYLTIHYVTDEQKRFLVAGNKMHVIYGSHLEGPNVYLPSSCIVYVHEPIGTINLLSGYIEFNDKFLNDNISSDGSYQFSELYAAFEYKYQASGNIAGGNWSSTNGSRNTNISGKGTVGGENNYLQGTQGRVHGMSNTLFSRHGSADGFHNFVEASSDDSINDSVEVTGYANYILDASGADASGHHNIILKGVDSTAKGFRNIVKALYGFVHGQHNIVTNESQTVLGKFNDYKKSKENGDLFTVGNGKNFENGKALVRSNAFGVKKDGTAYVQEQGDSTDSVVQRGFVEQEVEKLSTQINSIAGVAPEFANDISECTDTSKVYILPDGYIYAYTKEIPDVTYEIYPNSLLTHSSGADRYTLKTGGKYHLKVSNVLPAKEGDIFEYYGFENYNAAVYWLKEPINTIDEILDSNIVGTEKSTDSPYDSAKVTMHFTAPAGTNYVLFASISNNANTLDLKVTPPSIYHWKNTGAKTTIEYCIQKMYELERTSGVLANKKYVACGDSFTAAQKDGSFDTYPALIAKRNYNMQLINLAISGSDFTNIEGANIPFAADSNTHVSYKDIPLDADYITLMFGLNECINPTDPEDPRNMPELGDSSSIYKPGVNVENIGEISTDDYDDTNLWGAYSKVFDYLLSNAPYAKIGVIIADAWMTEEYANAVKGVCRYWGIPYLDLNAEDVPMGIRGRYWSETAAGTVSKRAISLRDAAFKTSTTDEHPNAKAHEYRSTIIENFLRSL